MKFPRDLFQFFKHQYITRILENFPENYMHILTFISGFYSTGRQSVII